METKTRRPVQQGPAKRRVIVVGKRQDGRWKIRMSLWRYLAATAVSQ